MVRLNSFEKLTLGAIKTNFINVINGITLKEILIFLLFPIVITVLMLLPVTIRETLSLRNHNYLWWQVFTSAFIHKDWNHLLSNIQSYLAFGGILLVFSNKAWGKKDLLSLSILILISLPLISSIASLLIYRNYSIETIQGSSGLISAVLGFFPILWVSYFSKKNRQNLMNMNFFYVCILYVALLYSTIYLPYYQSIILPFTIFISILILSFFYRNSFKTILKGIREESKANVVFGFLLVFIPLFFMAAPILLFPLKTIQNGSQVGIFVHYLGLIYGVTLSFIFFKIKLFYTRFIKLPINT